MKARWEIRRLSAAECDNLSRQAADTAFPAVVAAVLYVLYRRGWHKDKLLKLYDDVCAFLTFPVIFGKELSNEDVQEYLEKRIGIDWNKIRKSIRIG